MRKFIVLPLLFAILSCTAQTPGSETVFRNVNVIPMTEETVIRNQDVLVRNGEIIAVGNTGKVKFNKDASIIEGN